MVNPYRLPSSAVELLRDAAIIARRDMRDESAASILERQANIAEDIEAAAKNRERRTHERR